MSLHPTVPDIRSQDSQDRCLGDAHCYLWPIVVFWLFSNPRTRGALTSQMSWPLFRLGKYYLELRSLSQTQIWTNISDIRWTIVERLGLTSLSRGRSSQHMRAINPQSDHYILITTSANDYQLCQDAEREAGDSKETIFEQKGWKLSSKLEDKQFTARWSKKYHETHS